MEQSQYILGIKPALTGLMIDPCLPEEMAEYTVTRRYRGADYHIHVVKTGAYSLHVDGAAVEGKIIPIAEGKTIYHVEVTV